MMAIQPVGNSPSSGLEIKDGAQGTGRFVDDLSRMLRSVNQDQLDASRAIERLMVDGEGSIHEAMIEMTKAEGSFRLLMTMRNRLIDAVHRLLQTQV
jgi:flagellar hook-basal body complex protein FliE